MLGRRGFVAGELDAIDRQFDVVHGLESGDVGSHGLDRLLSIADRSPSIRVFEIGCEIGFDHRFDLDDVLRLDRVSVGGHLLLNGRFDFGRGFDCDCGGNEAKCENDRSEFHIRHMIVAFRLGNGRTETDHAGVRIGYSLGSLRYKILLLGDVGGKPGRTAVKEGLPSLLETYKPLFTIINGENSAGGVGITPDIAEELYRQGADAITLGNHAFNKREISSYLETGKPIVRPSNMPSKVPGRGLVTVEKEGIRLAVMNVCGRVYMESYDDPFAEVDRLLESLETKHRFLDFHAEATSEKIAMGWHCSGRMTAVVGTHTHVQTADETILPGGTAYITDVGMCGPVRSVLGMDREIILQRFRTTLPQRFEVANEPGVICGVAISVERDTGTAVGIERIRFGEEA